MRRIAQFVFVVVFAGLVGCTGGNQTLQGGNNAPGTPIGIGAPDSAPIQYAQDFPSALPQDSVLPWENLDANGMVVVDRGKAAAATSGATEFFEGPQTYSESGDTSKWNGALRLASGAVGDGNLSYAMYRIPLGGSEPGVVSVDANLRPMGDGNISGFYIGLTDYGNRSWQWFGPITDAHWRISVAQAARESADYTSDIGSVFVSIAVQDGATVDVVGIGIDPADPADTDAPPVPSEPTLTPVAGGLLVDWATFVGNDIAGYKVFYADYAYTDLTAFSATTLDTLHDSILRLNLEGEAPERWWVAISSVDLSGNESAISAVVSARPLASAESLPPVWIELDNVAALINQPIGMTATGADNYDWDLNGDGVFDVFGDATGTQNIDTSQAGIIRPLVRGNSSGGGFVALSAVSVIVTSNVRPVVQGFVEPAFGPAPLEVQFTSIQVDFDGDVVEWIWDFTSNNSVSWRYSTSGGAENPAPYTFTTPGLYNAKVRIWDDDGAWDVDTVTIMVTGNLPPVAAITSVLECQLGESVTFDGQYSHDPDGTIVQYEWDLDGDGSFEFDSTPVFWAQNVFTEPGATEVGLRVTDDQGAQGVTAILLTVHGVLHITVDDAVTQVGAYSDLAVVNGNPAISYFDVSNQNLKYARATDAGGTAWGTAMTLDSSASIIGAYSSLVEVDGKPAISYYDVSNGDLKYIRAADASGTAWDPPIIVDGSTADVGAYTSLLVVDGYPAISYNDWGSGNLKYIRALDVAGTAWGVPLTLDSVGAVGWYTSLVVVDGYPAISYYHFSDMDLKYVRATDAQGSAWDPPLILDSFGLVGKYTSMAVVGGKPAISYYDESNEDLCFIRSTDAAGTLWGDPVTLDSTGDVGSYLSMAVINGNPAISYFLYVDSLNKHLKCIKGMDVNGAAWDAPVILDSEEVSSGDQSIAEVRGSLAISYQSNNNLVYLISN